MSGKEAGGAKRRKASHKTENRRAIRDEREEVLLALLSHEQNQTFSNVLIKRTLDRCEGMSSSERAFIKRLLEGVIERKMELDARIEELTGRSVNRLHPAIRQILRMGIYQICYMDSVPDSAACNEAVRLAKKHGPARLSGFVNGVLRNAVRREEKARGEHGSSLPMEGRKKADNGYSEPLDGNAKADSGDSELMEEENLTGRTLTGQDRENSPAVNDTDWLKDASRKYSSPEWLVQMWEQELGREEAERLLDALLEIFPVSARVRCRDSKTEREALLNSLRQAGVTVEKGRWHPDNIRLRKTSTLRKLPGFESGLWTVQDESSMLAVEAAGLKGKEIVFDVCAAPGGKSFLAADLLAERSGKTADSANTETGSAESGSVETGSVETGSVETGSVETESAEAGSADHRFVKTGSEGNTETQKPGMVCSFDLTRKKTEKIREGAGRLGIKNMVIGERDARVFFKEDEGRADVVFCDLPCSGLGVIGKKRDIKYRASLEGIASLQKLQREILRTAVRYLKSGGVLIYSTCTVSRMENEDNAAWIESELGLVPDNLEPYLPCPIPGIRGHMLQLLPHVHGTDGFFVARFRKK